MRSRDIKFANNAKNAIEHGTVPGAWMVVAIIALLMVAFVWWASWAVVEQTTSGTARVIPSRQIQKVESLEPGIVTEILVTEGQEIEADQPLIRIDDTNVRARFGELKQRQRSHSAELERLQAQASLSNRFELPAGTSPELKPFYEDQIAVFQAEKSRLEEQLAVRRSQLAQRRQNLEEAIATSDKQQAALKLSERELKLSENLFRKRAIPELEYLRIQRLVAELKGDIRILDTSRLRIAAEIKEAENLIQSEKLGFVSAAQERISRVKTELSVVEESLRAAEDRVARTTFRSPVNGIISKMNVASIGEVIQPGVTVFEIVPLDDRLLLETKIRPQDVAFIRPGLPASIKLSAYDYTKYGSLRGIIERISADTITDENLETFYQVTVATDPDAEIPEEIRIIPGMVATVDIETGSRTVLEFLLKPIYRIRDAALRDPK